MTSSTKIKYVHNPGLHLNFLYKLSSVYHFLFTILISLRPTVLLEIFIFSVLNNLLIILTKLY